MDSKQEIDTWSILPEDRVKYETQFLQLGPVNGLITGEKVKPILMKSGLSTAVLGRIWGLADINGDGKLDKKEFAIAVHLIRKKLQGVDLPKSLPSCLKSDVPMTSSPVILASLQTQSANTVTSLQETPKVPVTSAVKLAEAVMQSSAAFTSTLVSGTTSVAAVVTSPTSVLGKSSTLSSSATVSLPSCVESSGTKPNTSVASKGKEQTGCSWAIPASDLSKYQQLFLVKDQKKRGYLTGLEAKAILSQFDLPVKVLAKIWNLADIDDDGRLVLEEFQLAMHFVGIAKSGKPVPNSLSPDMIPPSYRNTTSSGGTAGKVLASGPKISNVSASVPSIQPPVGAGRKSADGVTAVRSVSVAVSQTSTPVVSSVPKPSVDLLLLDDPFGVPPVELPVPLLEQGSKTTSDAQKLTDEATPPDVEFSCSVVWNVETKGSENETSYGVESENPELGDSKPHDCSEVEVDSSVSSMSNVTRFAEQEENSVEDTNAMDNVNPVSVPELQITTVEDAPASDDDFVETINDDEAKNLDDDIEKQAEEEIRFVEIQRKEEDEQRQLEKEKQLKLERDMLELERLRQIELENQRQLELEKQKRAELERQKRLESERLHQEELERLKKLELEKQKQMEKEKEEQRRKAQEQKEAAQRELQKQRQLDWEHQRRDQLIVLQARCENVQDQLGKDIARLKKDLATENNKKTELKNKIEKIRNVVGEYTSAIETMRLIRDKKLAETSSVQLKIEESKRKLAVCQQERQLLDTQLLSCDQHLNDTYKVILKNCTKKKATVDNLNEQLAKIDEETSKKMEMIEMNNSKLMELKNRMNALHTEVKTMQHTLVQKKQQWDTRNQFGLATSAEEDMVRKQTEYLEADQELLADGYIPYTALYQFDATSADELSLQPGVTVWVRPDQTGQESGWMIGWLNGINGCFPEAYVQPAEKSTLAMSSTAPVMMEEAKTEKLKSCGSSDIDDEKLKDAECRVISTLATSVPSSFVSVPSTSISAEGVVADKGLKAQAIYSWMAKKDNHLTFNKGDVIAIKEEQEMWWSGELNGKVGWFPKSYVKLIDEGESSVAGTSSDMAATVIGSVTSQPSADVTAIIEPLTRPEEIYVAAYPYVSDEPGDLTFNLGDIISVTKSEGDWWTGSIKDRSGIFPANFVRKTEATLPTSAPKEAVETGQKLSTVKKPEIATVIAVYEATGMEQLSLQPGQLIQVRKKTESGWWEGELQVRGQKRRIGWFPANYVKLLGQGGGSRSSVDNSCFSVESPTQKSFDIIPATSKVSAGDSAAELHDEKMMALYDYQSQCEDELSFAKGDVISIVSKEHSDWWKGSTGGKIGIFPANFVGHMPEILPE